MSHDPLVGQNRLKIDRPEAGYLEDDGMAKLLGATFSAAAERRREAREYAYRPVGTRRFNSSNQSSTTLISVTRFGACAKLGSMMKRRSLVTSYEMMLPVPVKGLSKSSPARPVEVQVLSWAL